jgi:MAF protein
MAVFPLIILASNSPRRRELLGWTGLLFSVCPADIDETFLAGETPQEYVLRLAVQKAQVTAQCNANQWVLAADTTVVDEGEILGKPVDEADAVRMLKRLRGHVHAVHTGLALVDGTSGRMVSELCTTPVEMRSYEDDEIEAYVATGDPLDKAGAYAIQHAGFHPVVNMAGCFACVIGLPLCHLLRAMRALQVDPGVDLPRVCQAHLKYDCQVTQQVLDYKI